MNLFGQIEKLIKEHGSASILRDHVNLLRERFKLLEKENASLKEENQSLKDKLEQLSYSLNQANNEIKRLNDLVESFRANQDTTEIDATTEQTLMSFFQAGRELSVQEVAVAMSLDIATTEHHIDVLVEKDLIIQTRSDFEPLSEESMTYYYLTPEGRAYIVKNRKS